MDLLELLSGDHDGLAFIVVSALLLPAGYISTKVLDWWDNR